MTETSDRYATLAGQMADRLAAVPPDGWDAVTPCDGWTVRDLLDHLIGGPSGLFTMVGFDPIAPGPDPSEDPVGAFTHVTDAVQVGLDDPAVATATFDTPIGQRTYEEAVSQFLSGDLVVHQWDLARAVSQDDRLDPDEVRRMYDALLPMDDFIRSPGMFGPKVAPPPDADEQTTLLCFLGRKV